ncbi:aconitase/3-isopropylmalate dehydratase large subunit family protein [Arthrobacter zhaoguopingii]|uniref:aconitase/3-isopropylmalate dehydratase large subunit family protein n=1 Tax=Arthrobacter zhaoguopingii TaxID=2681491 RepID=UPI001916C70B|nr:aconitase/3-isopropylmalate dehydratase large subunit family protein [Arthrobacter zhaoguopingii]
MIERILATHSTDPIAPGNLVTVEVDRVYVQDGNSPTIARLWEKHGLGAVHDPSRVAFVVDHSVLPPNVAIADRLAEARRFAHSLGVDFLSDGQGVSHLVALEKGWFRPGSIVVGSDSHTCLGGAVQALALGMGATDVAAIMATNRTWLRVPETVVLEVTGTPHRLTTAKDVLLHVLRSVPMDTWLYRAVEWCGEWPEGLSDDEAATVASMGVEMGAKCVFLPPRPTPLGAALSPTGRGDAVATVHLDVSGLTPLVALPHLPGNVATLDEVAGTRVGQVFVGTCTNGHTEDIAAAAEFLRARRVHPDVMTVVTPASRAVEKRSAESGALEALREAGVITTPPGCGACVGVQGPVPASGLPVLTTMNRNFKGRMGNPAAPIYLASPIVAAATALLGRIPTLAELEELT